MKHDNELQLITDSFVVQFRQAFERIHGTTPSVEDLAKHVSNVISCRGFEFDLMKDRVASLEIKSSARKKKQPVKPGDVIAIPLNDSTWTYCRMSPQYFFVEFYRIKSRYILPLNAIFSAPTFRLPLIIADGLIEDYVWRVLGNLNVPQKSFVFQHFILAGKVSCSETILDKNGFVLVDAELRDPTEQELQSLPRMKIASEVTILPALSLELSNCPIIETI